MRQLSFSGRAPDCQVAPVWQPGLLRGLLLSHYVLFGLLLGVQGALWDDVRRAISLGEGTFGTAMLLTPLVGFGALQVGGRLWGRFSQRSVALVAMSLIVGALLTLAAARDLATFLIARSLSGLGFALLDSAVNNAGLDWEQATGRRILSTLYAAFSAGAVVGALLAGALLSAGWGYRAAILGLVPLWLLVGVATSLSSYAPARQAAAAQPTMPLALVRDHRFVVLAALCLLGVFAEALADVWSASYVRALGADAFLGSAAFALFSTAMIVGRLANAALVERWGTRGALRCAYIGIAGAAALLAQGGVIAGAIAFAVLGLGVAGVVPTVLGASRQLLPNQSDAAANGIIAAAYLGFVVAAPTIGWLAQALGIPLALPLILGAIAVAMSWLSRSAQRPRRRAIRAR